MSAATGDATPEVSTEKLAIANFRVTMGYPVSYTHLTLPTIYSV